MATIGFDEPDIQDMSIPETLIRFDEPECYDTQLNAGRLASLASQAQISSDEPAPNGTNIHLAVLYSPAQVTPICFDEHADTLNAAEGDQASRATEAPISSDELATNAVESREQVSEEITFANLEDGGAAG